jgi:PAS domain S-box-containing protein
MSDTIRVLQVEDSESDAELIVRLLERAGYDVQAQRVEDAGAMRAALAAKTWDVIIADYHLPEIDAPAALAVLHESGLDLPFLVVSGAMGEDLAVAIMKAGAHDYVNKDSLARLAPAVRREIGEAQVRQERRRAEESLRLALIAAEEANHRYHIVAEHGRTIIWELDAEGYYRYVSHMSEAVVGYLPEELTGKKRFYDLQVDDGRQVFRSAFDVLARKRPFLNFEKAVRAKDGRTVWVSSNGIPVLDDRGEVVGYRGSSTDITDRKRAEEEGRLSEERYRLISENTADVIWLMDLNSGRYTYVSPSVQRMLGYSPEEIVGQEMSFVLTAESGQYAMDRLPQVLEAFAGGDESVRTQVHQVDHIRKDGSIIRTEVVTTLMRDRQGRPGEVVGVTRDITERVQVEARLMQAQKLESVGRLAGGVAHDFNNLLTVINGYSDMILSELPPGDALHELVGEIRTAGERAAALSGQLLVLSRKQVVQAKEVNLNDIIAEVEKMLGRVIGEDIRLESVLSPSLGCVLADPGQLHQVLMNLAVNARDAMPDGGTLLIETTNIDLLEDFAEQQGEVQAGHYALLSVSDTGVGMTADVMSHLFEPFFTTKKAGEGTGLGLATVYGIVKQCGGSIRVYSEPGRGTNFRIYLPRIERVGETRKEPVRERSTARGTETILVVEDQDQLRKIVIRVLQSRGYKALEAANPREALALSEGYAGPIHLLLTDVVMPGMTGPELACRLKPLRPSMEVIFMSGYSERALLDRQLMESTGAYLAKPFSPEALAIKVRETLGTPRRVETIVVADDEPGVRSFLSKILAGAGYRVLEAKNGREAIQHVETSGAELVITDLAMPEQEGIETIQRLHRALPQLKIIAISGQFAGPLLQATERLGAQASLAKPIQADELLQVVARVMHQ